MSEKLHQLTLTVGELLALRALIGETPAYAPSPGAVWGELADVWAKTSEHMKDHEGDEQLRDQLFDYQGDVAHWMKLNGRREAR